MPAEIHCPKCISKNVFFSKKRGINISEDCGHEFVAEKPVIPIVISSIQTIKESLSPNLMFAMGGLEWLDLSDSPFEFRTTDLIKNLKPRKI
jgi:hypothetical protein